MSLAVIIAYYNLINRLWVDDFQLQADNCKGLQIVQPKPSRDTLEWIETNCKETQIANDRRKEKKLDSAETINA